MATLCSLGSADLPLAGGRLLVDPANLFLSVLSTGDLTLPIPTEPSLTELVFYCQSVTLRDGRIENLALSNGLRVQPCR